LSVENGAGVIDDEPLESPDEEEWTSEGEQILMIDKIRRRKEWRI
jgi:hypothetical protein